MNRIVLILVVFLAGCRDVILECPSTDVVYTVPAGKFTCDPTVVHVETGQRPYGKWTLRLISGWDYVLPTNQRQWLKLCGDTFEWLSSNHNAVMLGVRHVEGVIQVSPYFNKDGERWDFEAAGDQFPAWPLVVVEEGQEIEFEYIADGKIVATTISYAGIDYVSLFEIDTRNFSREINFYAGGSVKPTQQLVIEKRRACDEDVSLEECVPFPIDPCGITVYFVSLDHPSGCAYVLWGEDYGTGTVQATLTDNIPLASEFKALLDTNGSPWIYPCD